MIAVDTNVLVYAHRRDAPWHAAATRRLAELATHPWAIPWPCVHEFVAVVTHPRIFDPPSALEDALLAVESWRAVATTTFLAELDGYLEVLAATARAAKVAGPRIHDARIAALCRQHAISELWTADRDFSRFAGLVVRNPLV
ncbi:PIN domain-containing protein [Candidatus Binatia bacterium]|nr:PIN domain-containing protein [Candidatus Binatia bacterium]